MARLLALFLLFGLLQSSRASAQDLSPQESKKLVTALLEKIQNMWCSKRLAASDNPSEIIEIFRAPEGLNLSAFTGAGTRKSLLMRGYALINMKRLSPQQTMTYILNVLFDETSGALSSIEFREQESRAISRQQSVGQEMTYIFCE